MSTLPPSSCEVLVAREANVMVVTLNRPQAMNAITADVALQVGEALEAAEADPEVRCIVLTGSGERAFCAGMDLKAAARGERPVPPGEREAWGFAGIVSHPLSKPLIAAVNGFAVGGGTEIVLACDIAVAAETANFGLPEVKRGILAAAGGAFRLPRAIGSKAAMELLLTGDTIDAYQARDLGLVNRVVAREEVMGEALAIARRIAANAPLAVQATKRIARGYMPEGVPDEAADWALSHREMAAIRTSEDAREGALAFAEKRAPVWKGR
ncbi:crotonase/enoyl-CoA hydratase family protein [Novosphingobium decolorationis]|uniref:Crotonase/enoyl-CoA hydratase family protein n=1 Tax=Novosphingobium decolorationis TaxID=2698673 RepID=A0ABX8E0J5_9SPHN|nr:crotonase/enoyl-CoA hydratase family protein [Novosphingobium decolorationis]QVM82608.1 crotonase/enoyl-CoA hydratase family protein [Novosphingobium decolorationis]